MPSPETKPQASLNINPIDLVGTEHWSEPNVRNMFGTCSQILMDYRYLDFWTHGNCRYYDFENSIFRKREVYTILENVESLIFEVLGASHKSLLGGNSNPGRSEHVRNMFGTCSEH